MQCRGCPKPHDCKGQNLKLFFTSFWFESLKWHQSVPVMFSLSFLYLLSAISCWVNAKLCKSIIGLYWASRSVLHNQYMLQFKLLFSKHDWRSFFLYLLFLFTPPLAILCSYSSRLLLLPFLSLCQVCSDINKPNGQFILPNDREAVLTFVSTLPIRKVLQFFYI